jgi:hypothetical protein
VVTGRTRDMLTVLIIAGISIGMYGRRGRQWRPIM